MTTSRTGLAQGSQTLARGLSALELIAEAPDGLTGTELARALGVHQSIAYRVLQTLIHFRFVRRDLDGRYRVGMSALGLAQSARAGLRSIILPILKQLSAETRTTAWALIEEGGDAVAMLSVEPSSLVYANRFVEGSRHPIDRGSAGYALLSLRPADPSDPPKVTEAREQGYVITHGEIASGSWGVAAPLDPAALGAHVCINLASSHEDVVVAAAPRLLQAVQQIADAVERDTALARN